VLKRRDVMLPAGGAITQALSAVFDPCVNLTKTIDIVSIFLFYK